MTQAVILTKDEAELIKLRLDIIKRNTSYILERLKETGGSRDLIDGISEIGHESSIIHRIVTGDAT